MALIRRASHTLHRVCPRAQPTQRLRLLSSPSSSSSSPLSQTRFCSTAAEATENTVEGVDDNPGYDDEDWVILGHLDRPLPFMPSEEEGEDVVRAETEMYRLYREILAGEKSWVEIVDLFCVADQELVATAFMWTMYLSVIPTLFGVKREFARLLEYSHAYDIHTLNIVLQRLYKFGSQGEANNMWYKNIVCSNAKIAAPNVHSCKIVLEEVFAMNNTDDDWWLERGILYMQSEKVKVGFVRNRFNFDRLIPQKPTQSTQIETIDNVLLSMQRHNIKPDFTLLYLLARACPVDVDYGRFQATRLAMMMETLHDDTVCLFGC